MEMNVDGRNYKCKGAIKFKSRAANAPVAAPHPMPPLFNHFLFLFVEKIESAHTKFQKIISLINKKSEL